MTELISPRRVSVDFSRSGIQRYIQLASLFRRRIESGEWPVGQQMPTVDELAAECEVARATVRQALDILQGEGLIVRYRAKGSFVTNRPQEQLWCEVETEWSGLLLSPKGATIEVLKVDEVLQLPNNMHNLGEVAPVYSHWRRRHLRNGKPYFLGDVYIDKRLTKKIKKQAFETKTAMRILKDVPGLEIAEAWQTLTLGAADPDIAHLLEIPLNAPIALVHRSAIDTEGRLVFVGDGVYQGDVVRLDIRLK